MGARDMIVRYARDHIGCAYSEVPSGGVEGASYNCSFLTTCAYRFAGLTIPGWQGHQNGDGSQSDWVYSNGHWVTDPAELQPGDLVFFGKGRGYTTHVGISLGGRQMIDSIPNGGVRQRELYANFVGGGWPLKNLPGVNPGKPKNDLGISYRPHVQRLGWMPSVRDGQAAGTTGEGIRMEALKICPPKGLILRARTHVQRLGDVTYPHIDGSKPRSGTGSSESDPIIGTIGRRLRMEALMLEVERDDIGVRVMVQPHVQGIGWTDPVGAGKWAGTRGKSKRLEAVRIWLERR